MQFIDPSITILMTSNPIDDMKKIEKIARVCYKSEDKITDDSYIKFIQGLIKRKHTAMLEHVSITVKIVTDRGISHEIVRHRLASFAQVSTRYCDYSNTDKTGNEISFIKSRLYMNPRVVDNFKQSEELYKHLVKVEGIAPEIARDVLPMGLATEIYVTANLREWRHIFDLRAIGKTGKPHPYIQEIMIGILHQLSNEYPPVFKDQLELLSSNNNEKINDN